MAFINISSWKPEQVAEWLRGLDDVILPYCHFFLNADVDGKRLLNLTYEDLESLNIQKIGHQELILEAVDLLSALHYSLESENLQSIALQVGCRARSLFNHLRLVSSARESGNGNAMQPSYKRLPTQVLSDVAYIVSSVKNMVSWLDRPPFDCSDDYHLLRNNLVAASLELTHSAQNDIDVVASEKKMQASCKQLSEYCDELIQSSKDSLTIQPATLEMATIKKKPDEELGMHIQSSYSGTHIIGWVKDQSPAESCGKIEEGDEVIQVNYQLVVGWQMKKLVSILKEKPKEVILMLKKRPRHLNAFGQNANRKRRTPGNKKISTFPKVQRKRSRDENSLRSPIPDFLGPNTPQEQFSPRELDDDDAVFRSGSESPNLNSQLDTKQRRATVSGGSPTVKRPSIKLHEFRDARPRGNTIASPEAERIYDREEREERDKKTKSFAFGEHLTDIRSIDSPVSSPVTHKRSDRLKVNEEFVPMKLSPKQRRHVEAAQREIPGAGNKETPQLLKITKKESLKVSDLAAQPKIQSSPSDENIMVQSSTSSGSSSSATPGSASTTPEHKGQRTQEKTNSIATSYTVEIIGGVPQRIPDNLKKSSPTQSPGVVRRKKTVMSRKAVTGNRRISCKDLGSGDCQGWLHKRKEGMSLLRSHKWTKVFCVLKNLNFYYYNDKGDLKAKGMIHLPGFQVSAAPEIKSKKFAFKVHHPGTTFLFASESQNDMSKWMNKMGLAAISYDASHDVSTGGFIKPEPLHHPTLTVPNVYYSESDDSDDEKISSSSGRPAPIMESTSPSDSQASLIESTSQTSLVESTESIPEESPVKEEKKSQYDTSILRNPQKSSLKTAESQDDLGKLYKNLQKANLGIDGVNMERRRKSALNQDLLVAKSSRKSQEILSVKKLQSLQRTLKAKEQELSDIEELLRSSLSAEKIHVFKENHPGSVTQKDNPLKTRRKYDETDL